MFATYSPEDNKLRLYPSARLDDATFQRVKDAGFRWAPKQELFVAPSWSCAREDLALELAGEIEPEEMTLAERAAAKAERLDALADKRAQQASAFASAARNISERFAMGQPILTGHHSERKALKDKERMESALRQSVKASDAVGYWLYRAEGVERYANRKNDPKVRARRIKTLLAELRDLQRRLNDAHKRLEILERLTAPDQIRAYIGSVNVSYALYSAVKDGELTPEEARQKCIAVALATINGNNLARWISHTLNRLAYEREMLGAVPRYEGELRPTLLQMFLREHGADKPKARAVDSDLFAVECGAPLPAHIGDGVSLELSGDEWRDLMQRCGYVPPAKKPAKPPILNFDAPRVSTINPWRREQEWLSVVHISKADYAKVHSDQRATRLSTCAGFRVRICPDPTHTGPRYSAPWVAVFITDQKAHPIPGSLQQNLEAEAAA